MKLPMKGPILGPMNGAAVKIAIGSCKCSLLKRSPTVPPETARKALPEKPPRNRDTMIVWIFPATAMGISDDVEEPADEIDGPTAVEFAQGAKEHWAKTKTKNVE